jgi:glycosyltransferase involved in cell wall biosynthesis
VQAADFEEDELCLGYIGGLHEYKGVFDLAAAIERCGAPVGLLVAGDGPACARLEARLGDRARFLGSVAYERMPAVYAAMDVCVLPSHTEGLPRVVLEAQAAGTPMIATRVGGVPEVIADGETGLLCPPHAPAELAAAIETLAGDADERSRLARRGRATVETNRTWANLYDRYERALTAVVRRGYRESR